MLPLCQTYTPSASVTRASEVARRVAKPGVVVAWHIGGGLNYRGLWEVTGYALARW